MKNLIYILFLSFFLYSCNTKPSEKVATVLKADSAIISGAPIEKELIDLNKKVIEGARNPASYNDRAKYYIKKDQLELALTDLIDGFAVDSMFMPLYNTLADYHLMKAEPAQAKLALEKALTLNKSSYMTYVKLGELYFLAKKYDLAFKNINAGLRVNKYYADGYFWKGMIYKEKGDTILANSNFQTAIEQDPENYKAYMQLGIMAMPSLSKNALDYFSSAIKVAPEKSEAYFARGYYYQLIQEYDKSIQDYTKVTQIDPQNYKGYFNLGIVQYALRVLDVAFKNFNKAIEINPKYAEAFYMRGLCNEAKANDDAAIADFEFAMSLKQNYTLAAEGLQRVTKLKKALKK